MEVRAATLDDIPALLALAAEFIAESQYGWTFYEEAARTRFEGHINEAYTDVLIGIADGEPAGLAIMSWDRDFTAEAVSYVVKFYVRPRFRGIGLARLLVDRLVEWSHSHKCRHIFASSTANIDGVKDKVFINLFAKYGFKQQGVCLVKEVGE